MEEHGPIVLARDADTADSQVRAVLYLLAALAYVDGEFDDFERTFVQEYIADLSEARAAAAGGDVNELVAMYRADFQRLDQYLNDLFTESTSDGETVAGFVSSRLKVRALELFQEFDDENKRALLGAFDTLIEADGRVHPAEAAFHDDLKALLEAKPQVAAVDIVPNKVEVSQPTLLRRTGQGTHALFQRLEQPYTEETVAARAAQDLSLVKRAIHLIDRQRKRGQGLLSGRRDIGELAAERPFLDDYTYVHPINPDEDYELIVFGDLHGCYSCLKAGLVQARVIERLEAAQRDPTAPKLRVVFLGDYIDRGRWGLEGVLRTALTLYCAFPEQVFLIRGNHEWFIERDGKVRSGVMPAEALARWVEVLGHSHFVAYRHLFDRMSCSLLFDRIMFVHGGIPRDDVMEKFDDLSALNDSLVRFQMMWSDPAQVEEVPNDLQKKNARFSFGRAQLRRFLSRVGAHTLVRGHEKIAHGFQTVHDDGEARLLSVFSSGGDRNRDLPERSSYRRVVPMALTVKYSGGQWSFQPWALDWEDFNGPETNAFWA